MVFGTAPALIAGACEGEAPGVRTFSMGGAAGSAFSAAVGPLIGGVLIQFASWSWLFAINIPFGVLIIIFTLKKVIEYSPDVSLYPLDLLGAFLITVAIFGLLLTQYLSYELPPEVLRLQGIVDPELLIQSLARGQVSMLNGHSVLLAQARQAWSEALNLLFILAGAASVLAVAGSLWLLRPVK
ncbi:hypothetical protein E2M60_24495 [Salmonella enterica subsp. enterica serovar Newport]|nr:hypothetical protein [Salmonella enterica subsp. enterica serovar Newport]